MAEVRKEGLEKHLLDKAGGALWEAKRHLEDASKERFINFEREITAARKQIDDAEQLWRETYKGARHYVRRRTRK